MRRGRAGSTGGRIAGAVVLVVILSLAALGLAACGGSSGGKTGTSSSSSGPYFNMETLASGIKEKLTETHPAYGVNTQITCIQTGKQTAECSATETSSGQKASIEVSISADGKSFISH
jgi:maltose-binding protein MalE